MSNVGISFDKNTKLSVTEISYSVGFADSNYFSNIFKKSVGLSPLAYRKKITEI
jgi:YesN/AraC family two-component response regulator